MMHRPSFPAVAAAILLATPIAACAQASSPAEIGAKLDLLHEDLQSILRALQAGGARAPASAGSTAMPTTAVAAAPDAITAKFFPADPGIAAFPSPENSRMLRTGAGVSGRPYLLDSNGSVHKLGPVSEAVPNGYTVNGIWAKGGGSDHSPVPQLLVRQGKVFAQANGGPWQFYNSAGGSLYNAGLPDAFQTDAGGQTTSNVAASSVSAPTKPPRQSPAPGSSGRTLKVCAACQYGSITAAIKAAGAGDTVDIGPGRYKEAPPPWTVPLKIVFENGAAMDLTGLTASLARGKGALVPAADSIIVNPVITGTAMDQKVAQSTAAIRPDKGAGYVDIVGGSLSSNQNGIAGGDVAVVMTVTGTKLSNNGLGDGYTHNIYMSHGTLSVTLKDVQSTDPNGGHAAKVRAFEFAVSGGSFEASSAAAIDVPDGTVSPSIIDGATIIKKAGAINHTVLDYATEDTSSGNGGMTLRNVTLELSCDNPAILVGGGSVVTFEPSSKIVGTKPEGKGAPSKGFDTVEKPGRVWFTADTHFGHAGARALYRRPFQSVPAMDQALIEAWNATVREADTVWHLGDFEVRHPDPAGVLAGLRGTKHLVFGNNDSAETRALPGWASVGGLVELVVDEVKLILCHYALRTWPGQSKGALSLHGHSHGRLKPLAGQFDVGVDARGFRPIELSELLS